MSDDGSPNLFEESRMRAVAQLQLELRTAENALAAAQAQAKELREVLREALHSIEHSYHCTGSRDQTRCGCGATGRARRARDALAAPSDTTALRALLLKVARRTSKAHDRNGNPEVHEAIVDAVLAKEGM